jgi:hypothetical protein
MSAVPDTTPEPAPRIDVEQRIATLRKEANELRFFANAAENPDVRRLLSIEADDREEQADALELWLKTGSLKPQPEQ